MITDIHCHYVPDQFFRFALSRPEFSITIKRQEGDAVDLDIRGMHFGLNTTFFQMEKQLERMQRDGVERAMLSQATPFIDYHLEASLAVEAAIVFNDGLAAAIAQDRSRFGGWALLPMQDPESAANELRRCVRVHRFIGGHIASNVRGLYLNDAGFAPIMQAAVDLIVPLFVHPADPLGKDRTRDYELTIVAGYLFDSTINILKMICSGFLDRWPTLKLVCAHGGAFSPVLRARMQREVDTNPSLKRTLTKPVGEYLRQLYVDSICFEPAKQRYLTEVIPVVLSLLGCDAPFPLGEPHPVTFVRDALPAAQARLVLEGNFDRLTGG